MDWTKEEVKLIVENYFTMLHAELNRQRYVKATNRQALIPSLLNRSEGSIEFKHQNISAAMINMGLPFIKGYKPRFNYQQMLEEEIADYLVNNKNKIEKDFEYFADDTEIIVPKKDTTNFLYVLIDEPVISKVEEREPLYRPIKTNYLEKEQNNRTLGEEGEKFVIEFEKWRLSNAGKENLANKIEWVSKDLGDGTGFDILSKNTNGTDRFIEVKTTKLSKETPIFLTRNEMKFASTKQEDFYLYRLFNFDSTPNIFIKNGDYNKFCTIIPETFKGYF